MCVSAVPWNSMTETGFDGRQGEELRVPDTGPIAAKTSAASQPSRCARIAPVDMPVT